MADPPQYGKVPREFFDRVIYPNLGAARPNVLTGPGAGLDNCIINVGGGQVLVASTDPMSYIAELGAKASACLSVHSIASDVATSGFQPQYAIFDFNLPSKFDYDEFEKYWKSLSKECEALGIAIVGGHTGKFGGLDSTIIGAGTIFCFGSSRSCLTPSGANEGDDLIVTKGAAIETTAVLSTVFPNKVRAKVGEERLELAQGYIGKVSVVSDALAAVKVGVKGSGVSAMHDATEGGVFAGLLELAEASRLGMQVDASKIPITTETREICELFEIDPYSSLSEGTLVISCHPSKAGEVVATLGAEGIPAAIVGQLVKQADGLYVSGGQKTPRKLDRPPADPYWAAYYKAKQNGWD